MRAKSAITRKPPIETQLEQQHQKSKILDEDRKNFHRQAEEIKEKNREEIEKLRSENQHLRGVRDELIASRKQRRPFTGTDASLSFSSQQSFLNKDENYLRRALDKERHTTKTKKAALFSLQDKLKEVQQNKLGFIEESPLMRNIRVLENRLDKVMIKYNEAQSIQKRYEQVVKRLREQRVSYDSQLSIIEASLKGKEQDFQELLLLAHDATHAKEAAYAEMKRFQQRRVTVQQMRSKYLNEKKQEVNQDAQMIPETIAKGDRKSPPQKNSSVISNNLHYDDEYQKQELNDYQQAFRKLKQVTGVVDANQIIQKFKTQGLTTSSLQELRESYRVRIDRLRVDKENLKKQLQDSRLVKDRGTDQRRRIDQIQAQTAQVSNKLERTSLKSNKLTNLYINIKAGIHHLNQVTKFYKKQGEEEDRGQCLEQDLKSINEKLRRMYDTVKNDPYYMKNSYKANANIIQSMFQDKSGEDFIKNIASDDEQEY